MASIDDKIEKLTRNLAAIGLSANVNLKTPFLRSKYLSLNINHLVRRENEEEDYNNGEDSGVIITLLQNVFGRGKFEIIQSNKPGIIRYDHLEMKFWPYDKTIYDKNDITHIQNRYESRDLSRKVLDLRLYRK